MKTYQSQGTAVSKAEKGDVPDRYSLELTNEDTDELKTNEVGLRDFVGTLRLKFSRE